MMQAQEERGPTSSPAVPHHHHHQKKASLLASLLGRSHHTTTSKSSTTSQVAARQAHREDLLRDREDDPSLMASSSTACSLSTHSTSSSLSSSSDETTTLTTPPPDEPLRRSCLKHRTQLESLEHINGRAYSETTTRRPQEQQARCIPPGTAAAAEEASSETTASSIRWGTVQIFWHGIILGANPAVSGGPPVTIEWDAFDVSPALSLNEYEAHRTKRPRRRDRDLVLPLALRHDMIERSFSGSDDSDSNDPGHHHHHREVLLAVIGEMDQIRQRRARTAQRIELHQKIRERFARSLFLPSQSSNSNKRHSHVLTD